MSLAERKTKLANLEHLFLTAERQLLFQHNDGGAADNTPPSSNDGEGKTKTTKKIKKVGWLKSVLRGKQDVGNSRKNTTVVAATKPNGIVNSKQSDEVLETLDKEKVAVTQEARDDDENKVATNTVTTSCVDRDAAPPRTSSPRGGGGGGGDNETDSIMELRMQNSEAFLASVCSLRSLGTFERDFINNIIAEQAEANNNNNDEKSTTTFEKDFLVRGMKNQNVIVVPPHPTQVFVTSNGINPDDDDHDDLTLDTQLSETTFENDVRCAAMKNGGDGMILLSPPPPTQIITPTKQPKYVEDSDELSSIATFLSETTFECDQRKRKEATSTTLNGKVNAVEEQSARPTTALLALHIENTLSIDDSQISVSTYEKDVAALNALAEKIGRKPSTQSKVVMEGIMSTASDRSCSTFEQDYGYYVAAATTTQHQRANNIIPASLPPPRPPPRPRQSEQLSRVAATTTIPPKQQQPLNETKSSAVGAGVVSHIGTPVSTTVFENDMINGSGPQANQNYNPEWFTGIEHNRKKGGSQQQRNVGGSAKKKKNVVAAAPSSLDNRSSRTTTDDLSDAMRAAYAKSDAMAAAAKRQQQSKISPLDVQLSQYRVSTIGGGGGGKEEGDSTLLGKFLCQAEQFIFKY
jgi:hypothetical protein